MWALRLREAYEEQASHECLRLLSESALEQMLALAKRWDSSKRAPFCAGGLFLPAACDVCGRELGRDEALSRLRSDYPGVTFEFGEEKYQYCKMWVRADWSAVTKPSDMVTPT